MEPKDESPFETKPKASSRKKRAASIFENNEMVKSVKSAKHWLQKVTGATVYLTIGLTGFNGLQYWRSTVDFYPFIVNVALLYFVFKGFSNRCKACGCFWAIKPMGMEPLESWQEYQDITRKDVNRNTKGEVISTTERVEQVVVTRTRYKEDCQCRACGDVRSEETVV